MTQQVIVVSGGLSHEREVSLESGRRVTKELIHAGFDVYESDVQTSLIDLIRTLDHPVVVPMLHGGSGEDGAVREVFELMGVHYVGTRAAACRASFDKALAVPVVAKAGLAVPKRVILPHEMFRDLGATALLGLIEETLGFPVVVKPTMSGSALGVSRVDALEDFPAAMVNAYSYGRNVVVEEYIDGVEVAVPVFDFGDGPIAFPPVEIRPVSGWYDFEARYTAGATTYICPAELDDATLEAVKTAAVTAHQALSLRDFSRADIIVRDGVPVFTESSVAPGMTDTSLVPLSLATAGQDFGDALATVVRRSAERQSEAYAQ